MVRAPSPPASKPMDGPCQHDFQIARILGVENAFAITQACHERAAGFLAEDIAVRQAPLAHRFLDNWPARATRCRRIV